jgi:glutaconate CoA-transferase subunit A
VGRIARRLSLEELVEQYVSRRKAVGIGGLHFHNTPMAIVRELIRQRIQISLLVPPIDGSLNADQLIGAGLIDEVQVAYLGLEIFGLAGRFRAAAEAGTIRIRDCEEAGYALALQAGAAGTPFAALPAGFLPETGPIPTILEVNPTDYRLIENPFTGDRQAVVRAISPDVSVIHCQLIDRRGNCGFLGATFLDIEMAKAGSACIVQAEREVDELPAHCRGYLPGYVVDAYCVLQGGAHPASSHFLYSYDREHIVEYAASARTDAGFRTYVDEVIDTSENRYRRNVDVPSRIRHLAANEP